MVIGMVVDPAAARRGGGVVEATSRGERASQLLTVGEGGHGSMRQNECGGSRDRHVDVAGCV